MKNKLKIFVFGLLITVNIFGVKTNANTIAIYDVDFEMSQDGIVKILNNAGRDVKTKVIIEKGERKYTYNIDNKLSYVNLPLQLGNGDYSVKIFENISGTKYKNVYAKTSTVAIKSEKDVFITSNQQVNWDKQDNAMILANKLVEDARKNKGAILTQQEIIDVIYDYVITNIDYDYDKIETLTYDYLPDIDRILEDGKGICYDYSVLFASMLRSQNIPTKLIKGYSETTDVYHAWNEIYIPSKNEWIVVDTTYDAAVKKYNNPFQMEKEKSLYKAEFEF